MDSSPVQITPSVEEDEWDTDGFVIPSLGIEEVENNANSPEIVNTTSSPQVEKEKEGGNIYLGPHGAPPSQTKQQEQNHPSRKQRFKEKLKEADRRFVGSGRENKMDSLRELVGSQKTPGTAGRGSAKDWLDPHCHESEFERRRSRLS